MRELIVKSQKKLEKMNYDTLFKVTCSFSTQFIPIFMRLTAMASKAQQFLIAVLFTLGHYLKQSVLENVIFS